MALSISSPMSAVQDTSPRLRHHADVSLELDHLARQLHATAVRLGLAPAHPRWSQLQPSDQAPYRDRASVALSLLEPLRLDGAAEDAARAGRIRYGSVLTDMACARVITGHVIATFVASLSGRR